MNRVVVFLLRVALIVLVLGALLAQVLVPIQATLIGAQYPEVADLAVPYSVAAILALTCVEVSLGAIWHLVSISAADRIFDVRALKWVNAIVTCAATATVLAVGVMVHLVLIVQVGGAGVFLFLMASVAVGATAVLLTAVMRRLLKAAIADRAELAEVI